MVSLLAVEEYGDHLLTLSLSSQDLPPQSFRGQGRRSIQNHTESFPTVTHHLLPMKYVMGPSWKAGTTSLKKPTINISLYFRPGPNMYVMSGNQEPGGHYQAEANIKSHRKEF